MWGEGNLLEYENRRIESVENPIGVTYYNAVVGVEYHGKDMDRVLKALVDAVEPL